MSETPAENLPQPMSSADLEVVIEVQKAELDRLLKENTRLHKRIDQLLALQEREQVLRQQMQSVLGATARPPQIAASPELEARAKKAERRNAVLKQALSKLVDALERGRR